MTFETFGKRIEEELATGNSIRIVVTESTLSALLSQSNSVVVMGETITLTDEDVMFIYSERERKWIVGQYKELYNSNTSIRNAVVNGTRWRTVTL